MKKISVLLAVLLLLIGNAGILLAQKTEEPTEYLTLYMGEMRSVGTDTPTRVVIGNPNIADIVSVNTKEVVIAGNGAGATSLLWWDASGEKSTRVRVLAEDMRDIKSRIDNLLKELNFAEVSTRTADSEGKVLLLGNVKTQEDMERIRAALGLLYPKTTNLVKISEEKSIVELDVEVLEINKDATKKLGKNWLGSTRGDITLTEPTRWDKKLATVPDAVFRVSEWTRSALVSTLSLLVQEGKARVLSRPKLACQSGKEAELLVGGEKPIMTTATVSGGGSSTEVEYKEYGIKLKMAPVVTDEKRIKLSLNVEVSDIGEAETLGTDDSPSARAYPLTKRSTSTQLYLNDGQTLSISGLIRQRTEEDLQKIPWAGDIPVLGLLFRHKTTTRGGGSGERGDTELVIMITPSILVDKPQIKETAKEVPAKEEIVKKAPIKEEAAKEEAPAKKKKAVKEKKPVVAPEAKKKPAKEKKPTKEKKAVKEKKPVVAPEAKKEPAKEKEAKKSEVIPQAAPEAVPVAMSKEEIKERILAAYIGEVASYIGSRLEYPWAAYQANIEGTVVLALHLSDAGVLLDVDTNTSSGSSILDENTMRIVRQISPYPSFPQEITEGDLWIQVPIVYNLKE